MRNTRCAPRSAAVLARARTVAVRVGDASHPPLPQRRTLSSPSPKSP
jgi:hypothetical protein